MSIDPTNGMQDGTGELVTLVGSNPLSSLSAILTLRPKRVTLVHSAQTLDAAEKISAACKSLDFDQPSCLEVDPTAPESIRNALEDISPGGWSLDYTGGTKAMSCQARLVYELRGARSLKGGGDPRRSFYVDDHAGMLVAEDGSKLQISDNELTIASIAALHGTALKTSNEESASPTRAKWDQLIDPNQEGKRMGDLLEHALQDRLKAWSGERDWGMPAAVLRNVQLDGRPAELDVIVQVGRRIGLVSCYAGRSAPGKPSGERLGTAKKKLFEVEERARQIGGDLARVALATRLTGRTSTGDNPTQVDNLRADARRRWTPNDPAVWGIEDLNDFRHGTFNRFDEWWSGS